MTTPNTNVSFRPDSPNVILDSKKSKKRTSDKKIESLAKFNSPQPEKKNSNPKIISHTLSKSKIKEEPSNNNSLPSPSQPIPTGKREDYLGEQSHSPGTVSPFFASRKNSNTSTGTGSPSTSFGSPSSMPRKSIDSPSSLGQLSFKSFADLQALQHKDSSNSLSPHSPRSTGSPSSSISKIDVPTPIPENVIAQGDNKELRKKIISLGNELILMLYNEINSLDELKLIEAKEYDLRIELKKYRNFFKSYNHYDKLAFPSFWFSKKGQDALKIIRDNFFLDPNDIMNGKKVIDHMVPNSSTKELFIALERYNSFERTMNKNKRKEDECNKYLTQQKILSFYWEALLACCDYISDQESEVSSQQKTNNQASSSPLKSSKKDKKTPISAIAKRKLDSIVGMFDANTHLTIAPEKSLWDDIAVHLNHYIDQDFLPTYIEVGKRFLDVKSELKFSKSGQYTYERICKRLIGIFNTATYSGTLVADQNRAVGGGLISFKDKNGDFLVPPVDRIGISAQYPSITLLKKTIDNFFENIRSVQFIRSLLESKYKADREVKSAIKHAITFFKDDFSRIRDLLNANPQFTSLKNSYSGFKRLFDQACHEQNFLEIPKDKIKSRLKDLPTTKKEIKNFIGLETLLSDLHRLVYAPLEQLVNNEVEDLLRPMINNWVMAALATAGKHVYGDEMILYTLSGFFQTLAMDKKKAKTSATKETSAPSEAELLELQQEVFRQMITLSKEEIQSLDQLLKKDHPLVIEKYTTEEILEFMKKIYRISSQDFINSIAMIVLDTFQHLFSKKGIIFNKGEEEIDAEKIKIEVTLDEGRLDILYITKAYLCHQDCVLTFVTKIKSQIKDPNQTGDQLEINLYYEIPSQLSEEEAKELESNLRGFKVQMEILEFQDHFFRAVPTSPRK